jgi:hypothetical protein
MVENVRGIPAIVGLMLSSVAEAAESWTRDIASSQDKSV